MGHVWLLIKFEVFLKGPKLIGHIIGQSGDNEFRKTKETNPRPSRDIEWRHLECIFIIFTSWIGIFTSVGSDQWFILVSGSKNISGFLRIELLIQMLLDAWYICHWVTVMLVTSLCYWLYDCDRWNILMAELLGWWFWWLLQTSVTNNDDTHNIGLRCRDSATKLRVAISYIVLVTHVGDEMCWRQL